MVGLGYVGLPLAIEFSKKYNVVGFDIDAKRVKELGQAHDRTLEVDVSVLKSVLLPENSGSAGFFPTDDPNELTGCDIYIVTVPTPTDKFNRPVL